MSSIGSMNDGSYNALLGQISDPAIRNGVDRARTAWIEQHPGRTPTNEDYVRFFTNPSFTPAGTTPARTYNAESLAHLQRLDSAIVQQREVSPNTQVDLPDAIQSSKP